LDEWRREVGGGRKGGRFWRHYGEWRRRRRRRRRCFSLEMTQGEVLQRLAIAEEQRE